MNVLEVFTIIHSSALVKYENGEVSLQKLYGEIMPAEYSGIIKKIYDSADFPRIYFDKNQNLYAFYNNTEEAKGKYFLL